MRLLQVWQMGGMDTPICEMSQVPTHQVLQQRMPEKCLGLPPSLVPSCKRLMGSEMSLTEGFQRGVLPNLSLGRSNDYGYDSLPPYGMTFTI